MASVTQIQALEQPKVRAPLLEERFAVLKKTLVKPEHKQKVIESYERLIKVLESEANFIAKHGPSLVPEIDFNEVRQNGGVLPADFATLVRERGCVILRNSLYWTPPQVQIRSHPKIMEAMNCISQLWTVNNPTVPIDLASQVVYPDRFRIRLPSKEAEYVLPAHLDSGSTERWEDDAYRSNYSAILEGNWQEWDDWVADKRIDASSDLYQKGSSCSCWRSMQAWISLSHCNTGEGTLRLLPSLKASVAYMMLRPLFENDVFDDTQPTFPGATPGLTQFKPTAELHPHLLLEKSIVGIPPVRPGDYAFWRCDLVHEVDKFHPGTRPSTAVYHPCVPLTPYNIDNWCMDFSGQPSFNGREKEHEDHGARRENVLSEQGMRAIGLKGFDVEEEELSEGQREVRRLANARLGFA
ncbi:DUF1479-domain-containing protein [Bimuria novae-zelandiae CBS 107.79]|uniref:DUF1479-domain-containing protein n=1 Tax=Bimuria novae-zelandiae CBS 107.79 TaxID=1447943 RepID=A0A6A5VMR8_9PLEO|nr:DUF1479-domain-containing protein [Bimuria novae-zelandiae CBS 107.79]